MLSLLKSFAVGILSLTNNEFIQKHNSENHPYTVEENQFLNREYTNEFYENQNHFLTEKHTNYIHKLPKTKNESIDWRMNHKVSSVKNQKLCGGCWAFSSSEAVESAWAIKNNILYNLSQQELIDCSILDHGCHGGSMDLAFLFIKNHGLCTNLSYPYQAKKEKCQKNNCEPVVHIKNHTDVTQNNENELKNAVSIQPVSVAIQANKRSFQMYQSGIYNDYDCGTKLDHGVLAVGYGHDNDLNMSYWIIKNSWGTEWGDNGYIKIERNINDTRGLCGIAMMPSYPDI